MRTDLNAAVHLLTFIDNGDYLGELIRPACYHYLYSFDFRMRTQQRKVKSKTPLNICQKSKRKKFMLLYSTVNKPLNERFTKIMKSRKKVTTYISYFFCHLTLY